jgi:IS30 family transposase
LIIGSGGKSAVVTLVERTTRFIMLGKLPNGHNTDKVVRVLTQMIRRLPVELRKSITWDQGKEMAAHQRFTIDTNIDVYFCDPHSPRMRGSNENSNGLIRYYLAKSTNLNHHSQDDLDCYAALINDRPRQTLNWQRPSNALQALIDQHGALTG